MPDFSTMGRRRALAIAFVLGLGVMWFSGAISRWGQFYSDQPFYRAQVAAFFDGRLALSHNVEAVTHDLAWIDGGVQQVWGLGVPMWLSIWEGLGRLVHLTPFPDRIAWMLAAALMFYVMLRAWFGPGGDRSPASRGAFLITALLPGVIAMLKGRIAVYEEAEAYAYGANMLLLGGMLMMLRRPTATRYVLLLAFAGATGLIRPTVWFFGAPTALLATLVFIRSRGLRKALRPVALASALFVAGGGVLYLTNYVRFGNGSEFGHRLNLEDLPGNIYATRFNFPFETVPASASAKELVGAMFGRPEQNIRPGFHFYDQKLHVWEMEDARWREYYFTTYTWLYVPLILLGIVLCALAWLRVRRGPFGRGPDVWRESRWLGLWALLGMTPLLVFYLRSPSVSSRYFLDVAPAFAVLVAITWRHVAQWFTARGLGQIALAIFAFWWGYSVITFTAKRPWLSPIRGPAAAGTLIDHVDPMESSRPLPDAYDYDDDWLQLYIGGDQWRCPCYVDEFHEEACDHTQFGGVANTVDVVEFQNNEDHIARARVNYQPETACVSGGPWPDACSIDDPDPVVPDAAPQTPISEVLRRFAPVALYRNGTNWDLNTGAIGVATYFFVDDPEFVEVEVSPARGAITPDFLVQVRAKIQLEELSLISTVSTARGVRLRFAGPRTPRYQHGLQVAFLAFGPPENLADPISGYKLWRVAWHDGVRR
jgi:hypothetical protein